MIKVRITDIKDPVIHKIYKNDLEQIEQLKKAGDPDINNKAIELGYKLGTYLKEITDNGYTEIEIDPKLLGHGRLNLIDIE